MSFFNRICQVVSCGVLVTVALGRAAVGASISFSAPVAITSDDILTTQPGNVAQAGYFSVSTTPTITVGAIVFNPTPVSSTVTPSGTATEFFSAQVGGSGSGAFTNAPPGPTVSTEFASVLDQGFTFGLPPDPALTPNGYSTFRLNNLTAGDTYQVQLLSSGEQYPRAIFTQFADALNSTGTGFLPAGNSSTSFDVRTPTSVIGTFTADATFQDVFVFGAGGTSQFSATLNAFVLREQPAPVPEPSTGTFLFLGGLVLAGFGVRQRHARIGGAAMNCSQAEA